MDIIVIGNKGYTANLLSLFSTFFQPEGKSTSTGTSGIADYIKNKR